MANCSVTDIAVDFLEKEKGLVRWKENQGHYRVPLAKTQRTLNAIDELTQTARSYGVVTPGNMYEIRRVEYNLTPGRTETQDYLLENGKTYYQILIENEAFISEFQQKYDQAKNVDPQLEIDFNEHLMEEVSENFSMSPELFDLGSKEDFANFLVEQDKLGDTEYMQSDEAYEEFGFYMVEKLQKQDMNEDFAFNPETGEEEGIPNANYTNTRTSRGNMDDRTLRNAVGLTEYVKHKRELLQKLKENLARFRKLNKGKETTENYTQKVGDFHDIIDQITAEIGQLTATDAETVFADIITEMQHLSSSLENLDTFKTENHDILGRLNMISNLISGQNIDGSDAKDLTVMFDREGIENFDILRSGITDLQNKYSNFLYNVAKNALLSDHIFVEVQKSLSDAEVVAMVASIKNAGKDINMLQSLFLGINSNDDSIITKTLNNIYQMNIRKVEQSVLMTEGQLEVLQKKLHIAKFDIDKFYGKDKNGKRTGRLISKFTNSWLNAVSNMLSIRADFESSNDVMRPGKFNELMAWHEKNSVIIDIRKIAEFRDIYQDEFGSHFKFSDQEMSDYETTLRSTLGRTYDDVIKDQLEAIENFFRYEQVQLTRANKWASKNITSSNPFLFLDNYYDNNGRNRKKPLSAVVDGEQKDAYNTGRYNQFIPLKKTRDSMGGFNDSGFYDAIFERDFETNEDAYQAQQHFQTLLSEHINPAYSIMGKDISALQLPMERKSMGEVFTRAKADGVYAAIKASAEHLINTWKDGWYEYRSQAGNQGIVANYSDAAMREIKALKSALNLKSYDSLLVQARELGLMFDEQTAKAEIVDAIARSEVIPRFSDDIFKNVLSVSKKASVQRARQDTAFIAQLLYNQFMDNGGTERLRSAQKFENWIKVQIRGHRNLGTYDIESGETGGISKQAKLFRRFSEADKELEKIFKEVSTGEIGNDVHFRSGDSRYYQKENSHTRENEFFRKDENADPEQEDTKISRQEFTEELNKYLKERINNLGISMTLSSFVSGTLGNLSKSFLGYNIKAGIKNRLEGVLVNTSTDADGIYWTTGNNRHSTRILTSANLVRLSDSKLGFTSRRKKQQLKTIDDLVARLGILQDRRDFRDKKNQVSNYDSKIEPFNVYNFAVGMPEYKNQIEIMLNILQDHVIKNYKGERVGFVNGDGYIREGGNISEDGQKLDGRVLDKGNFMPAYKEGTLELKDEYKYTKEAFNEDGSLKEGDLSNFINMDNIGLETFEVFDVVDGKAEASNAIHHLNIKIQDTINKTHGNYSAMDSQIFMSSDWGRFVMSFKRHAPELLNQRLGTFGTDIVQGKMSYQGRLRRLLKNPGATGTLVSALLLIHYGPLIALSGLGIGAFMFVAQKMGVRYFGMEQVMDTATNLRSAVAMLQEIAVRVANFPLVLTHSKFDLTESKFGNNKFLTKLEQDKTLNKDEIGAIRGMAQEISMYITTILFILLGKTVLAGDDDDEEKKQKRNFIDNYGNQLLSSFSVFTNPVAVWEDNTSLLLLASLNNTSKWLDGVHDYYAQGKGSHQQNFYNFLRAQPLVPAFTQVLKPLQEGGGPERLYMDEREYNSGQWFDEWNKSPEKKAKTRLENERKKIKEEIIRELMPMFKEEYSHGVAKSKAKDFATKVMSKHPTRKSPDETYEDVLKRNDFKKLQKEAGQYTQDYIKEKGLPKMD